MELVQNIIWRDSELSILDQTRLPWEEKYIVLDTLESLCEAIQKLRVRGAPAIGIVAAYGMARLAHEISFQSPSDFKRRLSEIAQIIKSTRPTAVNLQWAVDRLLASVAQLNETSKILRKLEEEAIAIHKEDQQLCKRIGELGASLFKSDEITILTHCNAGALATGGQGTALSVVYELHGKCRRVSVFADETRPLLQGARLTSWELTRAGIPVKVICDGAAASLLRLKKIDAIIVGADRIAANGDTANKIGTYGLALAAKANGVPFYVAAPYSTFDFHLSTGEEIPIEERPAEEIHVIGDQRFTPTQADSWNPAFDVTPNNLITAIITDKGILFPPFLQSAKKIQLSP